MRRHGAIVGAPLFHSDGNDRIGVEVVAGGPDRVMAGPRPVVTEKSRQPVALDDVAEMMIERPSAIPGWVDLIQAQDLDKAL
jgi:hypothetical protein